MTPFQIQVLRRAADMSHLPGTSLQFEILEGRMLQVRWLFGKRYVKYMFGNTRIVATARGRQMLETFRNREEHRARIAKISLDYQDAKR